jgi:hypothetical protein
VLQRGDQSDDARDVVDVFGVGHARQHSGVVDRVCRWRHDRLCRERRDRVFCSVFLPSCAQPPPSGQVASAPLFPCAHATFPPLFSRTSDSFAAI